MYYYNGAQRYEQFIQVGQLYLALILLSLALFRAPLCLRSSWSIYVLKFFLLTSFSLPFSELSLMRLALTSLTNHHPSVLWHCWLGRLTRKIVSEMTYNVSSGMLNTTIPYLSLLMPSWHWTAPANVLCLFGASATWLHWLCGAWMVKQSENSGDQT